MPERSGGRGDELHRIAEGLDGFGGVIRDLDAEFLLESHDQLDRVEAAVSAEIVDERGVLGHFLGFDAEMLDDDFSRDHDVAHVTLFHIAGSPSITPCLAEGPFRLVRPPAPSIPKDRRLAGA